MRRTQSGQAMLEFALAVPILFLLILGVLDAGRAVVAAVSLNNAAREGARYAALHVYDSTCTTPTCQTEVENLVGDVALGVDPAQLAPFKVTFEAPPNSAVIQVPLSYDFTAVTPLIGSVLGHVTITANSSMLAR